MLRSSFVLFCSFAKANFPHRYTFVMVFSHKTNTADARGPIHTVRRAARTMVNVIGATAGNIEASGLAGVRGVFAAATAAVSTSSSFARRVIRRDRKGKVSGWQTVHIMIGKRTLTRSFSRRREYFEIDEAGITLELGTISSSGVNHLGHTRVKNIRFDCFCDTLVSSLHRALHPNNYRGYFRPKEENRRQTGTA